MFAVIHLPNFPLQAVLRRQPDLRAQAAALVDADLPKAGILHLTAAAEKCGVVAGMTASQAMARCAPLKIQARSRGQEMAATEILLQNAYAFSPNIEATALGVCTLELKGLGLNGEAALRQWAEKIPGALAPFHLEARIGIAPTPELALLAAHGINPVTIVSQPDEFIAALPVAALNPAPEMAKILSSWGIQTVGEFLELGKNDMAERLGAEALELFECVSTQSVRPLKLVAPPETFSEQIEFETAIETTEPLLLALRQFIEQLVRRLESIYLVVAEFHFQLGLVSGGKYGRVFKIPSPTGNVDILFRMLQTHVETVRTDSPIAALSLAALPAPPETHQFGLFESTLRNPNQFAETMARLTAALGAENAGTPQVIGTHKPDTFRMGAPEFDLIPGAKTAGQAHHAGLALRRFRPPVPAQFEFRNDEPVLIRSRIFNGAIAEKRGPYLSSGHWWDAGQWAREEWDVATREGALLRIFRSNDGCFVEGVYD